MAARTDSRLSTLGALFLLYVCVSVVSVTICWAKTTYSRQDLLDLSLSWKKTISSDYHSSHDIPEDIARTPDSPWIVLPSGKPKRKRRHRKQKRGCRAGPLARLKKQPFRTPLPSIFLSNARSIHNKIDELRLQFATNSCLCNCNIVIITETWLQTSTPDTAIETETATPVIAEEGAYASTHITTGAKIRVY